MQDLSIHTDPVKPVHAFSPEQHIDTSLIVHAVAQLGLPGRAVPSVSYAYPFWQWTMSTPAAHVSVDTRRDTGATLRVLPLACLNDNTNCYEAKLEDDTSQCLIKCTTRVQINTWRVFDLAQKQAIRRVCKLTYGRHHAKGVAAYEAKLEDGTS